VLRERGVVGRLAGARTPVCIVRVPMRWAVAVLAATAAVLACAPPAGASTIVYQCGGAVCAIDPDAAGEPRQLASAGRLAGITADGRTASWVDAAGALVQAPVAGGAPRPVPFTGEVVNQPAMSPDGTRYLWWYPGPDGFGGLNAVWVRRLTVGQPETEGVSFCSFCVTSHGWAGPTSIAAFPADTSRGVPSRVCRIASPAEAPEVTGSCVEVLASDARGGLAFPDGNTAGTELVAVLSPGERTGVEGRIVRLSRATGAPVADVTAGTADTTPVFSPEGDRVAFERDGQIVVASLDGGAERVLGAGVYPDWGGPRLTVAATLAPRALRRGVPIQAGCAAACRLRATLQVERRTARRLKLRKGRTIAKASGARTSAGTATLRLRATRAARSRLDRVRAYRATLRVTVTPSGGQATTVTRKLRVRR
jgi:hypothetical protein